MFNKGDLVKITVHNPAGVIHEVYGNIGVIHDVEDINGEVKYYTVTDEYRNAFVYIESELTSASVEEICEVCRKLLEN